MTLHGPDQSVYAKRRNTLAKRLKRAVVFLPAVEEAVYSNDVHYSYRPDSNTRYLVGMEEPAAVMLSRAGSDLDGFSLFVRPRDKESETWTGRRVGIEGAREVYNADHAYSESDTFDVLKRALERARTFYYSPARDPRVNARVMEMVHAVNAERPRDGGQPLVITEASSLLAAMRIHKTKEEIRLMRKAARISAEAHNELLNRLRPGMWEYELEALVEYGFRRAGCCGPAYGTIVAGGSRATVLHYVNNDHQVNERELVLIDAGGEYGGYCADITRTIPVGAAYSKAQAALYDLVLAAQQRGIETAGPGVEFAAVHRAAVEVLCDGLVSLGILKGDAASCLAEESYKPYYMHRTSHWLGMDVHDVGDYRDADGNSIVLRPGMVLTVEPGLYFRPRARVPKAYRGIGIRIEDDVVITRRGREVLSDDAVKERAEVEKIRRRGLTGK